MNEQWEVRPCTDRLGHVTSYDICLPSEPDATGVAVVASVYSGEAVANEIADAHNTPDPEAAAEIKALREVLTKISRLSPSAFQCDRHCADAAKNIALNALKDHRKVRT